MFSVLFLKSHVKERQVQFPLPKVLLLLIVLVLYVRHDLSCRLANFSSMYGLQYLLGREFDETEQARRAALKGTIALCNQHDFESNKMRLLRTSYPKRENPCGCFSFLTFFVQM